jgi:hypothetical protein
MLDAGFITPARGIDTASAKSVDKITSSLSSRSTSQDPSCPQGFLCIQEACPISVICGPGETCINFEGTLACVQPGLEWCAINPSTFEGVGCASALCW